MKYKAKCTHIISQLLNIEKYTTKDIHKRGNMWYIEVDNIFEYQYIRLMETHMSKALMWYNILIERISK